MLQNSAQLEPIEKWDFLKARMIDACKNFAKVNATNRKIIISQLSEKVNDMECNLMQRPLTLSQIRILQNSKDELEQLLEERIKGVMFRTKA